MDEAIWPAAKRPGFMGIYELDAERVANKSVHFLGKSMRVQRRARFILSLWPFALVAGILVAVLRLFGVL